MAFPRFSRQDHQVAARGLPRRRRLLIRPGVGQGDQKAISAITSTAADDSDIARVRSHLTADG